MAGLKQPGVSRETFFTTWSGLLPLKLAHRKDTGRRDAQGKSIIREQLGPIKPGQAVDNMWNIN